VYPTTTVGVALVSQHSGLRKGGVIHTVTHVVCGTPTVSVMVRWEDIWLPDRTICQRPDVMAEKGMPLEERVSNDVGPNAPLRTAHVSHHVDVT
jgi:hypothetical protein